MVGDSWDIYEKEVTVGYAYGVRVTSYDLRMSKTDRRFDSASASASAELRVTSDELR